MRHAVNTTFVPVLTVMVDYGNAPFLWRVDAPEEAGVGGNICDGTGWDDGCRMSEGLWRKFADWAIEFDQTSFYLEDFDASGWDWMAFHEQGLQLTRWLKEEVGDAYRVVYYKPFEDPNHRIDERTEVLADGTLLPLPPFRNHLREPPRFCEHIVSGGQTGADRGALDFAIEHGYTHGGWTPNGRRTEDGIVPLKYQLAELPDGGSTATSPPVASAPMHFASKVLPVPAAGASKPVAGQVGRAGRKHAANMAARVTPTATSSAKGNKRIGCHGLPNASRACSTVGADGTASG